MNGLFDAVKLTRELCSKASATVEAVLDNDLETVAHRHRKGRAASFALLESATKALDAAVKAANDEIGTIKARLRGPAAPKDVVKESREAELRERLAMLPEQRRKELISDAIKRDDDQLVSAVLNARSWETNLSDADVEMFRHQWGEKRYPDHLKRLHRIEEAITATERAGAAAISFVDQLTDGKVVSEAEAKDKKASAALASVKA